MHLSLRTLLPFRSASAVIRWPVQSQIYARRNALHANNELSLRRAQREEVERFLEGYVGRVVPLPRSGDAPAGARR